MTPAEVRDYQRRVRELAEQRKELTMEEYTVDVTPLTPGGVPGAPDPGDRCGHPETRARNIAWREAQGGIAGVMRREW